MDRMNRTVMMDLMVMMDPLVHMMYGNQLNSPIIHLVVLV